MPISSAALNSSSHGAWQLVDIPSHCDERGTLGFVEANQDLPFTIDRFYYLFGNQQNKLRAQHAHLNLQQFYITLSGSAEIFLDNGAHQETITLANPLQGLLINPIVWRTVTLAADSVMVALVSAHYDETDYIRDYAEFKTYMSRQ